MNYRKLVTKQLSKLEGNSSDKTAALIGLVAGLAAGAVLGILFAPQSGKKTRELISDKALDLADDAKDGFYAIKDKVSNGRDSITNLKDRLVDHVKTKVDETSKEYQAFREAELEKSNGIDYNPN